MSLITLREIILAKIEISYGVDANPVGASDAVLVNNPSWALEGSRMNERPAVRSSLGKLPQVYGGSLKAITFEVEVKGSGTAGTAPEMGPLLRACGMGETIVPSTSVAYTPASSGHPSLTIYYYQDGVVHKLLGCRGNVSFTMEAGGLMMASFTFTGHSAVATDEALPTPTYSAVTPQPYLNANFTINSFAAVIASFNFDLGNQVSFPPDVRTADGYGEIQIVGRDVNGSFDPEYTLIATNDWETDFRSGTLMAIDGGTVGPVGNQLKVSMPEVYYREIGPEDREGIRVLSLPFGSSDVTNADSEVSLTFT